MPKQDYIPDSDTATAALLIHVRTNLPGFFTRLAITAATPQVVTQSNDAQAFDFMCTTQKALIAVSQQATNAKKRLREEPTIFLGNCGSENYSQVLRILDKSGESDVEKKTTP